MHKQYNSTSSANKWVYPYAELQFTNTQYTSSQWVGFSLFFTSIYVLVQYSLLARWFVGYIHRSIYLQYACRYFISIRKEHRNVRHFLYSILLPIGRMYNMTWFLKRGCYVIELGAGQPQPTKKYKISTRIFTDTTLWNRCTFI